MINITLETNNMSKEALKGISKIVFINKRDDILIRDFIFGKLLGYSDISINEYFIKNII